jgi:hypothetical protein
MKSFVVKCIVEVPDYYDDTETSLLIDRVLGEGRDNDDIIDYEFIDCEEV